MNGPAEDAYHAYHVALGTLVDAQPFESLPVRAQQAWSEVAGVTAVYFERLENAYQNLHHAENKQADLAEQLQDARIELEDLTERLKEMQAQKEALEAKAAQEPAAK